MDGSCRGQCGDPQLAQVRAVPCNTPRRAYAPPTARARVRSRSSNACSELRTVSTQFHSAAVDAEQHPKRVSKHRCSRPPSEPSHVRKLCSPAPRAHPNERAFLQSIALGLGHGPGRAWCRKRSPTMDLSCRTCTGGTSGGGHIQDVWLRELSQIRSLVRRAHAGPGLVAGPQCAQAAHAPASKHRAELPRLPSRTWEQEACDSLPSRAWGA